MWDWVGGRTSEMSPVGLLPAALQGVEIDLLLSGAKACDDITRENNVKTNPSVQLSLAWHYSGNGKGIKDMVILPYKDRLELFSRYLQQLIMESLGKELDLDGNVVHQGIAVYGNKGSTDQHAYIQQLRDGLNNFFVTFIEVLKDRDNYSLFVEPNVTSGDYLNGFRLGTRSAQYEKNRESITITLEEVSAFSVGVLIALYERAVGYYASMININAYHQPGVEAALAADRMGCQTLLISTNLDTIGQMSCNPAIGGLAKGHLVREIDALGGEMVRTTDMTGLQFRMLNVKKGPSVWAPRAQCDKKAYQLRMKWICEKQQGLDVKQGQTDLLLHKDRNVAGIQTNLGVRYLGTVVVITTGTFLRGLMHIGSTQQAGGRAGEAAPTNLSDSLKEVGMELGRLKTGTPPRLLRRSIDF